MPGILKSNIHKPLGCEQKHLGLLGSKKVRGQVQSALCRDPFLAPWTQGPSWGEESAGSPSCSLWLLGSWSPVLCERGAGRLTPPCLHLKWWLLIVISHRIVTSVSSVGACQSLGQSWQGLRAQSLPRIMLPLWGGVRRANRSELPLGHYPALWTGQLSCLLSSELGFPHLSPVKEQSTVCTA